MNLGRQSVLNDLSDLKKDLEQKIEANSGGGGGSGGLAVENIAFGSVFDQRATGMYTLDFDVEDQLGFGGGALFHIDNRWDGSGPSVGLNISWYGEAAIQLVTTEDGTNMEYLTYQLLTSKNTITDANGVIKAA